GAVQGARDGGRAFGALAVSADAATSAVTSVKTNVEQFAAHLSQIGALTAELAKLPDEGASIVATLGDLRTHLGDANRAWAEVADVTDGASQSMAKAGAALSSLEQGTRGAEQAVLNWSGGLMKAGVGVQALTQVTERAGELGKEGGTAQAHPSAQSSGPPRERLGQHSDDAWARADRG